LLDLYLRKFAARFGVTMAKAEAWKKRLDSVRTLAHRIDNLAWSENKARGLENHLWAISCSDFFGDPDIYERRALEAINEIQSRSARKAELRLALLGIPPICGGLFEALEERGARVVFDEIPRQFAMPHATGTLIEQYRQYTYPYDVFARIDDIVREVKRRHVGGAIHYVQSFCFRQVQDVLIRRALDVPLLTLECDRPGPLDSRTLTRIEAFLEMLA